MLFLKDLDNLLGISIPTYQFATILTFKVRNNKLPPHFVLTSLYHLRVLEVTLLVQYQGLAPQDKTSLPFL